MERLGERHPTERRGDLPAGVARLGGHAVFVVQVLGDLEGGVHRGAVRLGDGDGVSEMVRVSVREDDGIAGDVRRPHGGDGVVREKRVDGDGTLAVGEQEAGVAEKRDSDRHCGSLQSPIVTCGGSGGLAPLRTLSWWEPASIGVGAAPAGWNA